jgi:hypothetical protein
VADIEVKFRAKATKSTYRYEKVPRRERPTRKQF